jgi:hypothetical protein
LIIERIVDKGKDKSGEMPGFPWGKPGVQEPLAKIDEP